VFLRLHVNSKITHQHALIVNQIAHSWLWANSFQLSAIYSS